MHKPVLRLFTTILAGVVYLGPGPSGLLAVQPPGHEPLPDFDKRRPVARKEAGEDAGQRAAVRRLQERHPGLRLGWDEHLGTPKFIAAGRGFLTGPGAEGRDGGGGAARLYAVGDPHRPIKAFLDEHAPLFGYDSGITRGTSLKRDYVTKHNGLRTVAWQQQLHGIPVHEAVMVGHVTRAGELVTLSTRFLPGLEQAAGGSPTERMELLADPPFSAEQAVALASDAIGDPVWPEEIVSLSEAPEGAAQAQRFQAGLLPGEARTQLVWLPLNPSTLRLCWEVELSRRAGGERFRILVDAQSGEVLLRRCLTVYLSDATFRVYTSDSPSPFSPSYSTLATNQPPLVPRALVTWPARNTNASPIGWISDGENETRGNNVDAHLDRNADDVADLPRPQGAPFRVFDFPLDLTQPPSAYGDAAAAQLFYWCNWMHDRLYELGFTEAAGNFQKDNFGRGGLGNDALNADAQDGSGVNNANFSLTYDGEAPRMQMFVFNGPSPARDGDLDAEIVLHEYAHGLTDRLVGGGVGMSALQSGGLAEGWSDWYALALLSEAEDDIDGCYAPGGYATWLFSGLVHNYYFGIRRYPYSTDLNKNPLTFKDIDPNVADPHLGVPMNPVVGGGGASEVHNQGEVWCATLWEVRAGLIRKHGFAEGNELALRLVTDALKLTPPNPTFLEARDAILLADQVDTGGANFNELWSAFARRGMGFSALAPASSTTFGVREAFDLPDALLVMSAPASIASGPPGGPFEPACGVFALTNHTVASLAWTAEVSQPWLVLSAQSGTLTGGAAVQVSVCISAAAGTLPSGIYAGTVIFSNLTSGYRQSRTVQLRVMSYAAIPFTEGFETGTLRDFWSVTGTGPFRTQVTTNHAPHGGQYQLTMDSEIDGYLARNEATLGVDLAGYSNVVLKFWARGFSDEADGPPSVPFKYGADFDGVAISQDGIDWYEVQGLRSLPGSQTQFEVDLDAAVRDFGLSYGPTFRIRFNQYDNYAIALDGIALDDISLTGVRARRFSVSLPATASEGEGSTTVRGRVTLGAPVTSDLRVDLESGDPTKATVPAFVLLRAGASEADFEITITDNGLLEGIQPVVVTASATGYVAGSATMLVSDNEAAELQVKIHPKAHEGDGVIRQMGTVSARPRPDRDIRVTLASSDSTEIEVPAFVTILAGQRSADFEVVVVDDVELDGPQWATVTARVAGWQEGSDRIEVLDNDTAQLVLLLLERTSEGNGTVTNAGTLRLAATVGTNVTAVLTSGRPDKLTLPATVIIPAGKREASFDLTVVDNAVVDGTTPVTVTATTPHFLPGTASMEVLDDETPPMLYEPSPADGAANVPLTTGLAWRPGFGEIVVNGGFETGDFTGWTRVNGGYGDFVVNDGKLNPEGPDGPMPPYEGNYGVVSQQIGGGNHLLYQDVQIPADATSATFSWVDRIRNHGTSYAHPNQEFRVEIRDRGGSPLELLFTTQAGDRLTNDWVRRSFDITRYRGQAIRLAFVEVDNLGYFNVHIDNVSVKLGETGLTVFDVYFGTNPVPGAAELLGTTTNAFWSLPGLALDADYYWRLVSRRGAAETASPIWHFATRGVGPVARLEWSPISTPQAVSQPFAASLTAFDDIGNVATSFSGPVKLRALPGRGVSSAIVATEIDTGANDRVEFSNVSGRSIDIGGWEITIYDGRSWPLARISFAVPSNTVCRAGDVFLLNKLGTAPGAYPSFAAGTNFFWGNTAISNSVAVLLRDAAGVVVDFVCAVDAAPAQITQPVSVGADEWEGNPVPLNFNSTLTYQRVGRTDHNDASDWIVSTNSIASLNEGLTLPFEPRVPVALAPAMLTNFVGGVWNGSLVIDQVMEEVTLEASDGQGRSALSAPFAVGASNDLSILVEDAPDLALVGGTVTYTLRVGNSGPDGAEDVRLVDWLPPAAGFLSASSSQGNCTNDGGMVTCDFGKLAGGAQARVVVVVRVSSVGVLTNVARVSRREPEEYTANDEATELTTVNLPTLAIADVIALERDVDYTNLVFNVRLSAPAPLPVTVTYATSNGTAAAGIDYEPVAGELQFPPGTTNQSIAVPIPGDKLDEATESLFVTLAAPVNAVILDDTGLGRIQDNDPTPSLSIGDISVVEGPEGSVTNAGFEVTLSAPSGLAVSVNAATTNNTATAPADYQPSMGALNFPPGTTSQVFAVKVLGDRRYETNEAFMVALSTAVNASISRTLGRGTIIDDDAGELDHFDISQVASPQVAGQPFAVTVTARDGRNEVVTNFAGAVSLRGLPRGPEVAIGSGTNEWQCPLGAGYHDTRVQALYLAEEVGRAGAIAAISLNVARPPGQVLTNWTIRMKHTAFTNYLRGSWESAGWTTVYRQNVAVTSNGWVTWFLDTPFIYNGTQSLMIDFSFNNASWSSDGLCRSLPVNQARSLWFQTDSAFGDPLAWSGTNEPPPISERQVPQIRLSIGDPVSITPARSQEFSGGLWSGEVTVLSPASNIFLRVTDGDDHFGVGNDFVVLPASGASGDGSRSTTLAVPGITTAASGPVVAVRISGGDVHLSFSTVAGAAYRVEWADQLGNGAWTTLAPRVVGAGTATGVTDPGGARFRSRFYRVVRLSDSLPSAIPAPPARRQPAAAPPTRRATPR